MTTEAVLWGLNLGGVAVFAASGAIAAARRQMDLFGVLVLATTTAIGGGTLRDLVLGVPVSWVSEPLVLAVCCAAALATIATRSHWSKLGAPLLVADALGLALFAVLGAQQTAALGFGEPIVLVMGIMTAVAGGVIRDILAGEVPLVLRREIYATAALVGAATYRLAATWGLESPQDLVVGCVAAFSLRIAAIRFELSLPVFGKETDPGG